MEREQIGVTWESQDIIRLPNAPGAAKISSRGQDSPKLLELPPTPGSPSARPGGPGEHQRAEARQGTVGTMPNLAVKPPAG